MPASNACSAEAVCIFLISSGIARTTTRPGKVAVVCWLGRRKESMITGAPARIGPFAGGKCGMRITQATRRAMIVGAAEPHLAEQELAGARTGRLLTVRRPAF